MSSDTARVSNSGAEPTKTLTDRVRHRVAEAGLALEGRAGRAAPKSKRPRATGLAKSTLAKSANGAKSSDAQRESQSLRRVYVELKVTYQQYRRRTGRPAVPALKEAAHAFKQGPSLTSLVGVAVFLDGSGPSGLVVMPAGSFAARYKAARWSRPFAVGVVILLAPPPAHAGDPLWLPISRPSGGAFFVATATANLRRAIERETQVTTRQPARSKCSSARRLWPTAATGRPGAGWRSTSNSRAT